MHRFRLGRGCISGQAQVVRSTGSHINQLLADRGENVVIGAAVADRAHPHHSRSPFSHAAALRLWLCQAMLHSALWRTSAREPLRSPRDVPF
ncbi:hypothetical protein PG997_003825 [Apiospora hydei]|uniref:Uncharacterized protein n=1 Tax=Apiospora hydei TaxID=1337664 RepID=A0ABR1X0I7_9PEZI